MWVHQGYGLMGQGEMFMSRFKVVTSGLRTDISDKDGIIIKIYGKLILFRDTFVCNFWDFQTLVGLIYNAIEKDE